MDDYMPNLGQVRECDVLVVGCGGAGAMAAITAREEGADVLVIEKSDDGGGSTRDAGGNIRSFLDLDKAIRHYALVTRGNTAMDVIEACVRTAAELPNWLSTHGGQQVSAAPHGKAAARVYPASSEHSVFDDLDGADGIGPRYRIAPDTWTKETGPAPGGTTLWQVLAASLNALDIPILYSIRARRLERDVATGRIVGVHGETRDGPIEVRARRGVVLASGGFADNPVMKLDYFGADLPSLCAPGRRMGDGIRMAQDVGADLHHMNSIAATYGYRFPDHEGAFLAQMKGTGFIITDRLAHRYDDESSLDSHSAGLTATVPDAQTGSYLRMPSYLIFDEETRYDGPIVRNISGFNAGFDWSHDNSREIKRGWIKQASSISELADQLELPADNLVATVEQYNAACAGEVEDPYGRKIDMMRAIASEPFYGVPMWPSLFNTQGGPKRNGRGEVISVFGDPIPGLYSAGELGSMWSVFYPGAGNITEALATGVIAGRSAASL